MISNTYSESGERPVRAGVRQKYRVRKRDAQVRFSAEPMVMLAFLASISAYGSLRHKPERGFLFHPATPAVQGRAEA